MAVFCPITSLFKSNVHSRTLCMLFVSHEHLTPYRTSERYFDVALSHVIHTLQRMSGGPLLFLNERNSTSSSLWRISIGKKYCMVYSSSRRVIHSQVKSHYTELLPNSLCMYYNILLCTSTLRILLSKYLAFVSLH